MTTAYDSVELDLMSKNNVSTFESETAETIMEDNVTKVMKNDKCNSLGLRTGTLVETDHNTRDSAGPDHNKLCQASLSYWWVSYTLFYHDHKHNF